MQTDEAEARIDADAADGPRFRLPPRTMAAVAVGFLLLVATVAGGWAFLTKRQDQEAARVRAEALARVQAENEAVANSPENLEQLAAARQAHEAIMAAGTLPAADAVPAPAPAVASAPAKTAAAPPAAPTAGDPAPAGLASSAPTPAAPAVASTPSPAVAAPPPPVPERRPPPVRAAAPAVTPVKDGPTPSVANDPPALGPGGCSVGGAGLGQSLGRCLEEYNRIERETQRGGAGSRRRGG